MKPNGMVLSGHIRPMEPVPTGVAPDLKNAKQFDVLLFDVYGTLVISRAGEIGFDRMRPERMEEIRAMLQRYGMEASPEQLWAALQRAIEQSHAASRKRGISHPEVDIVALWTSVLGLADTSKIEDFALEWELILNPTYPMPGLETLVTFCLDKGIAVGLVSNAQFYTPCLLSHFIGASRFKQVFDQRLLFYSWQWGHAKPSAFLFAKAKAAIEKLGLSTQATLYVGNDMRNDILPAVSVGFTTALFAGDRRSLRLREDNGRCRDLRPDLVVTDLDQLVDALRPFYT